MIFQRYGGGFAAGTIAEHIGAANYLVSSSDTLKDHEHIVHRDEILSITNNPYDGTR